MRRDKLLEKMRANPRNDWRIEDVQTLANRYGLSISRPKRGGQPCHTSTQFRCYADCPCPLPDKTSIYSKTCGHD